MHGKIIQGKIIYWPHKSQKEKVHQFGKKDGQPAPTWIVPLSYNIPVHTMFCVTFQVQLLQCLPKPNPKCFPATLVQHSSHSISMSSHLTLHHPLWFQIFSDLSCSCMQQNQAGTVKRARKKTTTHQCFPDFLCSCSEIRTRWSATTVSLITLYYSGQLLWKVQVLLFCQSLFFDNFYSEIITSSVS